MAQNKKYHLITIGCQMNIADSERLASFLEGEGYRPGKAENSGLVLINTCGVRQMAEDRLYGLVNNIRESNRGVRIVVLGCLSQRPDVQKRLAGRVELFLPTSEMLRLPELLKSGEAKARFSLDAVRLKQGEKYLKISPKQSREYTAYLPIGNGCNNFCSYCVVPYARGREVYRPAKDIIKEARKLILNGCKEIVLIAQNVNSYKDGECDFPKLLSSVAAVKGDFWIRFTSSHPKDLSPKLIDLLGKDPKLCPHLHLAVQSGDDEILKAMNRKYRAEHFESLIAAVRVARPDIAITTDVIVGFPGESKKQFQNTAKLFKRVGFDMAYIAQFSPRPGTAAALMKDDVKRDEKKRRETALDEILKRSALKHNKAYLGRVVRVLIEGKNRRGRYYGKTGSFKTVAVEEGRARIGQFALVEITGAKEFGLEGKILKQ